MSKKEQGAREPHAVGVTGSCVILTGVWPQLFLPMKQSHVWWMGWRY